MWAFLFVGLRLALGAVPLPSYNALLNETSVSGLSSGAYMAVQLHVAYSSIMLGAGIFAGGPYYCAKGSETTALTNCMTALPAGPDVNGVIAATTKFFTQKSIDDPANLAKQNVYMFSGTQDTTVHPAVMNALEKYYQHFNPKITYEKTFKAAHTQPTDDPINKNACTLSSTPYISDCKYDGAGKALQTIFGTLQPRAETLTGDFIEFDQSEFVTNIKSKSMAETGWLYVPKDCSNGAVCRVHVSLHGCLQNVESVGTAYVKNAGFNKWADTNKILVVYPQTVKNMLGGNPNGCWDWWGYIKGEAQLYTTQQGSQMAAIRKMIAKLTKTA